MSLLIIGKGRSGQAALKLANTIEKKATLVADGDELSSDLDWNELEQAVVSPGVPPSSPWYKLAAQKGLELISELEFAAQNFNGSYIAITGTNGKTTTTELVTALLNSIGERAVATGNIGIPFSKVVADVLSKKLPKSIIPIIEVSSFQLELVKDFKPTTAGILNITADHLDRYPGGMTQYTATKARIFNNVSCSKRVVGGSLQSSIHGATSQATIRRNIIFWNKHPLTQLDKLKLHGVHNYENILMALELIGKSYGDAAIFDKRLICALENFSAGQHRVELVAQKNGIRYINDSKGTNPAAVLAALDEIGSKNNVHLILGGAAKDTDFSVLLSKCNLIQKAYLIGACKQQLHYQLANKVNCAVYNRFEEAVSSACNNAKSGEAVMLSPGCASFDMFSNYIERGEAFKKIIAKFIATQNPNF